MNKEQLIAEALSLPLNSIAYFVSQRLATAFPEKALIEGEEHYFNVEKYAAAQHCRLELKASIYNQVVTSWEGPEERRLLLRLPERIIPLLNHALDQFTATRCHGFHHDRTD